MAISLELPKKFAMNIDQARQAALEVFRPISRKYDLAEHEYPVELDTLAALYDGLSAAGQAGAGAAGGRADAEKKRPEGVVVNGGNMQSIINSLEASYGDVGLMLSLPFQGLGNAAIAAVATDEQLERLGKVWASMAITEPSFGSDSAAVSTTATLDGDDYIINGEKIFVTSGSRASHVVVWATLDRSVGRAAIKSFVVPMDTPGVTVARLEHKLGIKGSPTAELYFENCTIPDDRIIGDEGTGFKTALATLDHTRPTIGAQAVGVAQGALWVLAILFDVGGPFLFGSAGWRLVPGHFAERHGLIILIALGESIVAIGVGVSGLPLDAGLIGASLLGLAVTCCLWWAYFDVVALVAERKLRQATGRDRAALARDSYSLLHLPMIAGIVLLAFGLKSTVGHVGGELAIVPAVGVLGPYVGLIAPCIRATHSRCASWMDEGSPIP